MELEVGSYVGGVRIIKRLYQRKAKGGAVYSACGIQQYEEGDNLAACRVLADCLGWTCILLPPIPDIKTPDMMKADDLTLWEIKTNNTGSTNSIDNELRAAKDQSKNVIIRFNKESFDTKKNEKAAIRRARRSGVKRLIFITGKQARFIDV